MSINVSLAGIQKPVSKETAILWFADAGTVETSEITATSDLEEVLKSGGAITTDGISQTANSEDPEVYLDFNGNTVDSSEATSTPSINFSILEVLNPEALELVFNKNSITSTLGKLEKIEGNSNPTNKLIVLETRIKNKKIRVIFPEVSFASRGDDQYANDSLYSYNVTYNILTDANGKDIIRLYSDIV